jgi:hypothetical protein
MLVGEAESNMWVVCGGTEQKYGKRRRILNQVSYYCSPCCFRPDQCLLFIVCSLNMTKLTGTVTLVLWLVRSGDVCDPNSVEGRGALLYTNLSSV